MNEVLKFNDLDDLRNHIVELVSTKGRAKLAEKPPCDFEDVQDQMRAAMRFMRLFDSCKQKGSHWPAIAYLTANLRYHSSSGDMGKCGHILLEVADCLFSCREIASSKACCHKAIDLLIRGKDKHDWTRGMAAIGELLLVAIELNNRGHEEAVVALRAVRSALSPRDKRILSTEDGHRLSRRLISAYKTKTDSPLLELEKIPPRRKRIQGENLLSFLLEWMANYGTVRQCVERISPAIAVKAHEEKRSRVAD